MSFEPSKELKIENKLKEETANKRVQFALVRQTMEGFIIGAKFKDATGNPYKEPLMKIEIEGRSQPVWKFKSELRFI